MADRTKQLQEQVATAASRGQKLAITGGGSKAFMGRQTQGDSLPVSEHSGIVSYQPVELVLTVRAGTPLKEIDAALAEHNQILACEPPLFNGDATIGGSLACHQSGPGRPWWGSIRDHVLGIRLLNGNGELMRFGGQVMKNVAGYDVARAQAGAMGTLGVITEVSLKVLPRPAASITLTHPMPRDEAIALMNTRAAEPKPLTAACWVDGHVYLRLSGARSAVEATAAQWQGEVMSGGDAFWQKLRDQHHDFFTGDTPLWRFSTKPSASLPDLDGDWLIDWAGAQRWYRGEGTMATMAPLATEAGGQVSLFRGGDREGEVMHPQADPLKAIQQRLKTSFDPNAIFNPGRVYSWL